MTNINKNKLIQELIDKGKKCWDINDSSGAIAANLKAYELDRENYHVLNNLGMLHLQIKEVEKGINYLEGAIKLEPKSDLAYQNLITYYLRNNNIEKSKKLLKNIDGLKSDKLSSLSSRLYGDIAIHEQDYEAAVNYYKDSLEIDYFNSHTRNNLGKALLLNDKINEAKQELRRVIEFEPDYYPARINLAAVHCYEFNIGKSIKNIDIILEQDKKNTMALIQGFKLSLYCNQWELAEFYAKKNYLLNKSNINARLMFAEASRLNGNLKRAQKLAEEVLENDSENLQAIFIQIEIKRLYCEYDELEKLTLFLLDKFPDEPKIYLALFYINKDRLNFEVAEKYLKKAIEKFTSDSKLNALSNYEINFSNESIINLDNVNISKDLAQLHMTLAMFYMYLGQYEKGWIEYQWRYNTQSVFWLKTEKPMWQGEDIQNNTRLLIWEEQGYGDTLQFIRYIEYLNENCDAEIIIKCQPRLENIISSSFPDNKVLGKEVDDSEFDLHFPLVSLPTLFGTNIEDIPVKTPYLNFDTTFKNKFIKDFKISDNKINIGIVWAGNKQYPNDFIRSPGLKYFKQLLNLDNTRYFSLQYGERKSEIEELGFDDKIEDITDYSDGFENDASILKALDLLITSDTGTVHLAGALGVKTWCVIPFSPDWRWTHDTEYSIWYPTIKLYRQKKYFDWASVFKTIKNDLKNLQKH